MHEDLDSIDSFAPADIRVHRRRAHAIAAEKSGKRDHATKSLVGTRALSDAEKRRIEENRRKALTIAADRCGKVRTRASSVAAEKVPKRHHNVKPPVRRDDFDFRGLGINDGPE